MSMYSNVDQVLPLFLNSTLEVIPTHHQHPLLLELVHTSTPAFQQFVQLHPEPLSNQSYSLLQKLYSDLGYSLLNGHTLYINQMRNQVLVQCNKSNLDFY